MYSPVVNTNSNCNDIFSFARLIVKLHGVIVCYVLVRTLQWIYIAGFHTSRVRHSVYCTLFASAKLASCPSNNSIRTTYLLCTLKFSHKYKGNPKKVSLNYFFHFSCKWERLTKFDLTVRPLSGAVPASLLLNSNGGAKVKTSWNLEKKTSF
jgi:hypothetical protein